METNNSNITLGEIFRRSGEQYIIENNPTAQEKGIIRLLSQCRTIGLGSHIESCSKCDYSRICYNSCRNRHCTQCQYKEKEQWFMKRKQELLPVGYFHIIFTIPLQLNRLVLQNRKVMYTILFKAASSTLLELAKDPKHLGAVTGLLAVLHTWGQNLMEHPHLHCIVPAGGVSSDKEHWVHSKHNYFIPVQVISSLFRGKFCDLLNKAYASNKLQFKADMRFYDSKKNFNRLLTHLYKKNWVVHAKEPFARPEKVLEYLSRYINRVAISNRKIIKIENNKVTFLWKDYRNNDKLKRMTIDVFEFIRRFLLHVLPDGFCKIRYYGLFANNGRKDNIEKCKTILLQEHKLQLQEKNENGTLIKVNNQKDFWDELFIQIFTRNYLQCPKCKIGKMVFAGVVKPETCDFG